jgi:O-antigen biosynthesis protein
MENQDDRSAAFIITGMHRSGTSLTSSLMESAGINIGTRLIGITPANPKGHFENWDFVDFHVDVLDSQGLSSEGWVLQKEISISQQLRNEAKLIIERNSTSPLWGWKDPRTTLCLNFWQELLPQAYFIFTYRAPWEVADSLYRRGDETFAQNPTYALEIWMHYNQLILDFYHQFSDRSILLNIETLIADRSCISQLCKDKFGIELKEPTENIIDKSLMSTLDSRSYRPLLIKQLFPEVIDIFNTLNDCADIKYHSSLIEDSVNDKSLRDEFFHDWLNSSKLSKILKQLQQAQIEIEQLRSQLQQLESILQKSESELSNSLQNLDTIYDSKLWKIKNTLSRIKGTIIK